VPPGALLFLQLELCPLPGDLCIVDTEACRCWLLWEAGLGLEQHSKPKHTDFKVDNVTTV
jgi:hypothetical protein